ncbi:calcitonin gene-related peptide type 1 receptor-like [Ptychodera flava]|uniref:calcitonin gene-related peptide type 1 receptor-like n=1 Tax=Ptychodera flava TaxID=63121 RepID=UPI00396A5AAE
MNTNVLTKGLYVLVFLSQIKGLCDGGESNTTDFPWSESFMWGDLLVTLSPQQQGMLDEQREMCFERIISDPYPTDGGLYCNRTFDGWGCWNDTRAGEIAYINCPNFITGSDPTKLAHKVCLPDGNWFVHPETNQTWSNYTLCEEVSAYEEPLGGLIVWYVGYSCSIVTLSVSLVIFFYFKNLSCPRITLHKNLFFSFIFNGISWILWFAVVAENPSILENDDEGVQVACKMLNVMTQYFQTCNYFWMLCEGIYLHTLIVVAVFSERSRLLWYYLLGWVAPFVPVTIYTILRAVESHGSCWLHETAYEFIIAGPIIAVLAINLVLLLNIVRVLITKLRATHTPDTHNYRKAVRATLILLPLLGLHFIIMPFQPANGGLAEQIYDLVIAILISFQGFFVACIYCFFNGEIRGQISRKYRNYVQARRGSDFRTRAKSLYTTTSEVITVVDTPEQRRKNNSDSPGKYTKLNNNQRNNSTSHCENNHNANNKNALLREEYGRRNSDNNDVNTSLV